LRVGAGVARLRADWRSLISRLPRLGHIRSVTENASASIQAEGVFSSETEFARRQQYSPLNLDLRTSAWTSAFVAVQRRLPDSLPSRNIHFYGDDDQAIHSIHLTPSSSIAAFEEIMEEFVFSEHGEDSNFKNQLPNADHPADVADQTCFTIRRVDIDLIVSGLSQLRISVEVSVSNAGCTQTHCGTLRKFSSVPGLFRFRNSSAVIYFSPHSIQEAKLERSLSRKDTFHTLRLLDARGSEVAAITPIERQENDVRSLWRRFFSQLEPITLASSTSHLPLCNRLESSMSIA
jgi:putative heme degradation protein